MEEKQMKGDAAIEAPGPDAEWCEDGHGDALDDEMPADGYGGDVQDVENVRRIRLRGFLRELVRVEGKMEAAELLGVNYKTLDRAEKTGEITRRMGDALERLAGTGDDPEVERLREAVDVLEQRVAALEGGAASHRVADAEGDGGSDGVEHGDKAQAEVGKGDDAAGRSETEAAPPVTGPRAKRRFAERRKDPEVVTVEPADDDPDVYGVAWPLVEEWRRLRANHSNQGKCLWWLTTHERLLVLELAMLENHGLTLPPETQALRGFGRRGQTSWRWKALADTRTALRKRKLLRWVMPWRWREKAPDFAPGPVLSGR